MTKWFQIFLLLSVVGSLLTGILWILKQWTRKHFSPHWEYVLWIGVLLVMVVPISVKMPTIQPILQKHTAFATPSTDTTITDAEIPFHTAQPPMAKAVSVTEETSTWLFSVWDLLALVWITGALGSFGYRLLGYRKFLKQIRKTGVSIELDIPLPKRLRVYQTKDAVSPMVTGIFRPILLLPKEALSKSHLPYVLRHELTHYCRGDLLWRWLAVLAMSIHWFQPMVYVAVAQMQEACELSCDWCVVRCMEQEQRDDYMRVILALLATTIPKKQIFTTQMASGKKQLQRRFTMIRNQKPCKKKTICLSVCVGMILLSGAWLTGCALQQTYVPEEAKTEVATNIEGLAEDGVLLFVGTGDVGMADTIFTYDVENEKANIRAIPRDAKTIHAKKVSGLLMEENGDAKLIQAVSQMTGQPVADYIRMDLTAVETIIDHLDGVIFSVPQDMDYEDDVQNLSIHLKAGEQRLSGNDALGLLRYRKGYPQKDLSRIAVQQAFLQQLFAQKCNPAYLKEIPALWEATKGHVVTNLTISDMVAYGKELYQVKQNGIDAVAMGIL